MALIEWSSSLQLGVEEIDNQHRKLVAMINELNDAMRQGKGKTVLGKIVDGLTAYTGTHFKTEEKYFQQFAYAEATPHTDEHAAFVRKVTEFRTAFGKGKLGLSIDVINFLSDWLQNHILVSDRKYVAHFKASGLK
jgi:hemerythrin